MSGGTNVPGVTAAPLLEVEDLRVEYRRRGPRTLATVAVDGVSLSIHQGETLGLVGESGSGKSTIGRAVLGLTRPTAGRILFGGHDVTAVRAERRRGICADLQMVFQDPYSSLPPARTVGQALAEPLEAAQCADRAEIEARLHMVLGSVHLPADAADRYPHAFSGGQRQRLAIARALTVAPRLIVADEALSALDLVTQAQVLELLRELQQQTGVGYLFIAHNLPMVAHLCDTMAVLYRGRLVESGPARRVYRTPLHPYTNALLAAVPVADPAAQRARREARTGLASPLSPPVPAAAVKAGCPFAQRCPAAEHVCRSVRPALVQVGEQTVACHAYTPGSGHSAQR